MDDTLNFTRLAGLVGKQVYKSALIFTNVQTRRPVGSSTLMSQDPDSMFACYIFINVM